MINLLPIKHTNICGTAVVASLTWCNYIMSKSFSMNVWDTFCRSWNAIRTRSSLCCSTYETNV